MTSDELRELDRAVHEKVMGHAPPDVCGFCGGTGKGTGHGAGLPCFACDDGLGFTQEYSTDLRAAWLVVEKLSERWTLFSLVRLQTGEWGCRFGNHVRIDCETPAIAICRAALKAVSQ